MYFYTTEGGTTEWTLPEDWTGDKVYLYRLTDQGKKDVVELTVGADRKINYGRCEPTICTLQSSSRQEDNGYGVKDYTSMTKVSTANIRSLGKTGDSAHAEIVKSQGANEMLRIQGNTERVTLKQRLTDLKPNTRYAV